jgi:uncharacterized protein (TIGR00255 family)
MTGFGQAHFEDDFFSIICEVKALNSRFLDIHFRTPANLKSKELDIRKTLSDLLHRGKIDINISIQAKTKNGDSINQELFKKRHTQLKSLSSIASLTDSEVFKLTFNSANFWEKSEYEINDDHLIQVENMVLQSVKNLIEYRKKEGESMLLDLNLKIDQILSDIINIQKFNETRKQKHSEKLKALIEKNVDKEHIDNSRLEQELLFYFEKWDINEEIVRLEAHCAFFKEVLENEISTKGKKLNFIAQEIGREINTIGSKSNLIEIQKEVVSMKESLEKIKELVLNIL